MEDDWVSLLLERGLVKPRYGASEVKLVLARSTTIHNATSERSVFAEKQIRRW